jgi:hypothetical protein
MLIISMTTLSIRYRYAVCRFLIAMLSVTWLSVIMPNVTAPRLRRYKPYCSYFFMLDCNKLVRLALTLTTTLA